MSPRLRLLLTASVSPQAWAFLLDFAYLALDVLGQPRCVNQAHGKRILAESNTNDSVRRIVGLAPNSGLLVDIKSHCLTYPFEHFSHFQGSSSTSACVSKVQPLLHKHSRKSLRANNPPALNILPNGGVNLAPQPSHLQNRWPRMDSITLPSHLP